MVCVTSGLVLMRNGSAHVTQMLLRAVVTYMDNVVVWCQTNQSVFPFSFFFFLNL